MTGGTWSLLTTLQVQALNLRLNSAAVEVVSPSRQRAAPLTFGTASGSGQFGDLAANLYPLQAGASVTFDLFDGSASDAFGDGMNLRVLHAFAAWIDSGGSPLGVTVGGGDANPHPLFRSAGATQTVYPNGPPACGGGPAGQAVTSSARTVKITNNAAVPVTVLVGFAGGPCASGVPSGLLLANTYP